MYYKEGSGKEGSADRVGKVVLSNIWNSNPEGGWESTIIMMDQVVRQNEDEADYKEFLKHIRTGTMTMDDCKWMISKCHDAIDPNELATFDNALHICPTWKVATTIYKTT